MNMIKSIIDFNEKKGFICDMDGVIYHGNQILPGVPEFIQWLHDEKKDVYKRQDIMILADISDLELKAYAQQLSYMTYDFNMDHDTDIKRCV